MCSEANYKPIGPGRFMFECSDVRMGHSTEWWKSTARHGKEIYMIEVDNEYVWGKNVETPRDSQIIGVYRLDYGAISCICYVHPRLLCIRSGLTGKPIILPAYFIFASVHHKCAQMFNKPGHRNIESPFTLSIPTPNGALFALAALENNLYSQLMVDRL